MQQYVRQRGFDCFKVCICLVGRFQDQSLCLCALKKRNVMQSWMQHCEFGKALFTSMWSLQATLVSFLLSFLTCVQPRYCIFSCNTSWALAFLSFGQLLLEAVKFGVIAIPYEYEGTTLDALMEKLRLALQGRQAK